MSFRFGRLAAGPTRCCSRCTVPFVAFVLVQVLCVSYILGYSRQPSPTTTPPVRVSSNPLQNGPQLCVIARAYSKNLRLLPAFFFSLSSSRPRGLNIFVLRTDQADTDETLFTNALTALNSMHGSPEAHLLPVLPNAKDAIPGAPANDFGYVVTDIALEQLQAATIRDLCAGHLDTGPAMSRASSAHPLCLMANTSRPLCDYFMFTNADNLYADALFPHIRSSMEEGKAIVAWDFVSHHDWPPKHPGVCPEEGGTYVHMTVALRTTRIDLGASVVRADWLRANPSLRFLVHKLRAGLTPTHSDLWNADGLFIERLAALAGPDNVKLFHNTWFLHQ